MNTAGDRIGLLSALLVTTAFSQNSVVLADSSGEVAIFGYHRADSADNKGTYTDASVGNLHTIALRSDGTLRWWGENPSSAMEIPADLGSVRSIHSGSRFNVAVLQSGLVRCWGWSGWSNYGQCTPPADLGPVQAVSVGFLHSLAINQEGLVRAWGYNVRGQCNVPGDLGLAREVAAGGFHSMALRSDGTVRCWGAGATNSGQSDEFGQSITPPGLTNVTSISAGYSHSVALRSDGGVVCWGYNALGQCSVPSDLPAISQVATTVYTTFALTKDGQVRAWGADWYGIQNVTSATGVERLCGGASAVHLVTLQSGGRLRCWGNNWYFQCGIPADLPPARQVAISGRTAFAVGADGSVRGWGSGFDQLDIVPGDLGRVVQMDASGGGLGAHCIALVEGGSARAWGSVWPATFPIPGDLAPLKQVSAGGNHQLALQVDGTVRCWGDNDSGVCNVPGDLFGVTAISAGTEHSMALRFDGSVRCWGSNWNSQCDVPADLGQVRKISAGNGISAALLSNGSIRFWQSWQQFDPTDRFIDVVAGNLEVFGLRADGTVACPWQCNLPSDLGSVKALASKGGMTIVVRGTPSSACVGDLDGDGSVGGLIDGADLGILLANWGPVAGTNAADLNNDWIVDGADLGILLANWGPCPN